MTRHYNQNSVIIHLYLRPIDNNLDGLNKRSLDIFTGRRVLIRLNKISLDNFMYLRQTDSYLDGLNKRSLDIVTGRRVLIRLNKISLDFFIGRRVLNLKQAN